MTLCSLV